MDRPKHLLLTGKPGVGKTTVIKKTLGLLSGCELIGFFTEEIRERGKRVGFKMILLPTYDEGVLAHRSSSSPYRLGKYGVEVGTFERMVIPMLKEAMTKRDSLLVIDEIGTMELMSKEFKNIVRELLRGDLPSILGTLQQKRKYLLREWGVEGRVKLVEVTEKNRNEIPKLVSDWFSSEN